MELAYIWVSEFRNIINQGFNISSKYIFKHDSQRNILNVEKNPRHIPDFFGPDISNITGIIGQNASGKTNLLELILYTIDGGNTKIGKPFFVIYENGNGLIGYEHKLKDTPKCNQVITFKPYKSKVNLKSVFLSNTFDGRDHNFGKSVFNGSINKLLTVQFGTNVLKNIKDETSWQIEFFRSKAFSELEKAEQETNPNSRFRLRPEHLLISTPSWNNIIKRAKYFDQEIAKSLKNHQYDDLTNFCRNFRRKITDGNFKENKSNVCLLYFTAFLVYLDLILNAFQNTFMSKQGLQNLWLNNQINNTEESTIEIIIEKLAIGKLANESLDRIFQFITEDFSEETKAFFKINQEAINFLNKLPTYEASEIKISSEGAYNDRRINYKLSYNDRIEAFLIDYFKASSNENLTLKVDWLGISSGHKAFISLFSRIYNMNEKGSGKNLLICIDEGDLYFHPKWQTEFVYKLIRVLPKMFEKKFLQLILTTHSPFLVSDLPKYNLLFLEKDFEGNCKILDKSNEEFETFGGNIGELYLDAFFLKDRLISYFAALKIRSLIDKIKTNKPLMNEENILLCIIGNKLLKNSIENLIHDKT